MLFSCLIGAALAGPGSELFEEHELSTGVRLSVLHAKDAARQTFFAFLPVGLAHDEAGCTQWSHLLEHMVIRTTDPIGMNDGDIAFNGETGDSTLRLEVHAPPELAPIAAGKLLQWLAADTFELDVLEREKGNIASEIETTAARGFTHKWATAAWAQVARHGASDVGVMSNVRRAQPEDVAEYADSRLKLGKAVRIVAVGPMAPADVRSLFDRELASGGGLDALANALGGNPRAPKKGESGGHGHEGADAAAAPAELATGERRATWDLPCRHVVEWYLLPDETAQDRLAATVIANALAMTLQSDPELGAARIVALAAADVVLAQGRVLYLSASLPDAGAEETALAAFRRAIDGLEKSPAQAGGLEAFVTMARNELSAVPDFAAVRRQWKGRPGADLVEAQIALGAVMREESCRLSFGAMGAAAKQLSAADLLARRDRFLAAGLASRVHLAPRD